MIDTKGFNSNEEDSKDSDVICGLLEYYFETNVKITHVNGIIYIHDSTARMSKLDKRLDFAKEYFGENIESWVIVILNKYGLLRPERREHLANSIEAYLN